MPDELDRLISEVQRNCDITDSRYAQTYGICTYLIKMREYFLWRNKLPFDTEILNEEILPWIGDLEEEWETLEEREFEGITVGGVLQDPFETEKINADLLFHGLVYSGGYSQGGVPSFFLARLESDTAENGFQVLIASDELARGLFGAPAMLRGNTIFIRKHALKLLIWARYEEWRFIKRKNTSKTAFDCYDFEGDALVALDEMTEKETQTLISHEIGEGMLNEEFGPEWREMITDFSLSKTEIILRAVKDLAADCVSTLPKLLSDTDTSSLHFYFANFSDMRKELFPELFKAYKNWSSSGDLTEIRDLVATGEDRWQKMGRQILGLYMEEGKTAAGAIHELVGQS